ncbi:MAG: ABC transporter [Elusimicrobia bacterium CG_4_9_14_3_um_filter_62_55]|nr:MAG: ABC transporter [Elusimicrobia bacterium CG_4_10_14_0_2_um_filter_63_34]PJB24666.1 MAG: ABC transporter [Elusimicrobia bacterium CG_4_9_14_3_um_filter_62_55]
MSDEPAIKLQDVTKNYGRHTAVDRLSLSVPRGSVYGFIGPNGSGKTTTLRVIMHILLPDSGIVEVLGARGTRAANDRIGYLPEERGLYKKMTVRQQLAYYAALKGVPTDEADREGDAWLDRMGLTAWAGHKVEALSKGMMQKIQFISTVVSKPELVILDEPFAGLDPVNVEVMRSAILSLRENGATVVLSTHDMQIASEMCDFVLMMHKGGKVLDGTLDSIRDRYGADTIRIGVNGGKAELLAAEGVTLVRDLGRLQEIRVAGDPRAFLHALSGKMEVRHFEIVTPSLHDIFLRIAGPDA